VTTSTIKHPMYKYYKRTPLIVNLELGLDDAMQIILSYKTYISCIKGVKVKI